MKQLKDHSNQTLKKISDLLDLKNQPNLRFLITGIVKLKAVSGFSGKSNTITDLSHISDMNQMRVCGLSY